MSGTNRHDGNGERLSWPRRAGPLVAALATIGLLAGACGGGSKDPGVASGGGTTTTVAPSGSSGSGSSEEFTQTEKLQFAHCMRSHGVPNYPDPSANGGTLGALASAGINPQSPTVQSALQACKKYTPAGHLTPAQTAAQNAKGLQVAQCMRSHGVPKFPDPSSGPLGGQVKQVTNLSGTGIDPSSPTFQAAAKACGALKK